MESIRNSNNASIVLDVINAIHENSAYLSEIDGATGDGDHGINMNKGFLLARDRIPTDASFSEALRIVGRTLVMDIGGSMGPIYGTMFSRLSKTLKNEEEITKELFLHALESATEGLMELAGAKIGDKTLIDTLYPAKEAFKKSIEEDKNFKQCLEELAIGATSGKDNTRNLVAKIGRAARLGERSKGYLDAGATSCFIILKQMSESMQNQL